MISRKTLGRLLNAIQLLEWTVHSIIEQIDEQTMEWLVEWLNLGWSVDWLITMRKNAVLNKYNDLTNESINMKSENAWNREVQSRKSWCVKSTIHSFDVWFSRSLNEVDDDLIMLKCWYMISMKLDDVDNLQDNELLIKEQIESVSEETLYWVLSHSLNDFICQNQLDISFWHARSHIWQIWYRISNLANNELETNDLVRLDEPRWPGKAATEAATVYQSRSLPVFSMNEVRLCNVIEIIKLTSLLEIWRAYNQGKGAISWRESRTKWSRVCCFYVTW